MATERKPRIRITSNGTTANGGTKVEVITKHGAVVDISNMVTSVVWMGDVSRRSVEVALTLRGDIELDVLGDLTNVMVES